MYHQKHYFNIFMHKYLQNKELDELFLSVFLKNIAQSMISIFIPIYLLTLGYSLVNISIYYLIYYTTASISFPFCTILNSKIGIKKGMAIGTLILILSYFLLEKLNSGFPYYILAIIFGVASSFYFSGFHIEFTRSIKKKETGKDLSILKIIAKISSIIGPLTGALFINYISFKFIFLLVSGVLFISIIPLFLTKDYKNPIKISFKKIIKSDTKVKALAYQVHGALYLIASVFWPIFIYLTIKSILSLGAIITMTSVIIIFIINYLGKIADKKPNKLLKTGIFSHSISWILKILLLSPLGLFFSNFVSGISSAAIDLSFHKKIYEKAKNTDNITNYFIFREMHLGMGRFVVLIIAIITNNIIWMFIVAVILTLCFLPVLKDKE